MYSYLVQRANTNLTPTVYFHTVVIAAPGVNNVGYTGFPSFPGACTISLDVGNESTVPGEFLYLIMDNDPGVGGPGGIPIPPGGTTKVSVMLAQRMAISNDPWPGFPPGSTPDFQIVNPNAGNIDAPCAWGVIL